MNFTALSIVALCFEAVLLCYVIIQLYLKRSPFSKKTLWYSVPVYLLVYYIYTIGFLYTGDPITPFVFFKMIAQTLSSFVFSIELGYVTKLALDNPIYMAAAAIALIYAGATLVASIVAFTGAKMKNDLRVRKGIKTGKVFVIGDSDIAKNYAKNNDAIIVTSGSRDEVKALISKRFTVAESDYNSKKWDIVKLFRRGAVGGTMYHFIAFQEDIRSHEGLINAFIEQFEAITECGFTLHVEATLTEMDVINRKFIDRKTADNVCVKSFNKYELIARKFIIDAPIAKYLPEDFYGEYRTIKKDKKINVVFLGFGKVNYEMLKLMVIQNQFVTLEGDKFRNFPVNYYVYDNSEDKICSDTLLTLRSDMKRMQNHELPLPEAVCNIAEVNRFHVFSEELADKVYGILSDKEAFNYLIVSVGSDLENVATAERFAHSYSSVGDRLKVFARTRDNNITDEQGVICFGNEGKILSRDVIVNAALDTVSRAASDKYNELARNDIGKFNTMPTIEKYSNIYHAISLYHKVGMLGFEFVRKENAQDRRVVSKHELHSVYGGYKEDKDYGKYFELSVWNMLGFSEHSRWVAQYILNGFRPMALSDIVSVKSADGVRLITKNIDGREHCCLTDYYGLDSYHRYLVERYKAEGKGVAIEDVETYKYDYMLVDSGYDNMVANGFVLVEKK